MAKPRKLRWLLALCLYALVTPAAQAQDCDPQCWDYDWQLFAPAELGCFGGEPSPRTGWYGEANRMYLFVTRPERGPGYVRDRKLFANPAVLVDPNTGAQIPPPPFGVQSNAPIELRAWGKTDTWADGTWGNRIDLGYMCDSDWGFFGSFMHVGGPNEFNVLRVERINRINEADDPQAGTPEGLISDQNIPDGVLPPLNIPGAQLIGRQRSYYLQDTVNFASLSSFEFNKMWRRPQLHNGGIFEPFFGIRYVNFRDRPRHDSYQAFDATGAPLPPPPVNGPIVVPDGLDVIEQLVTQKVEFNNHMFGGQLGARCNVWRGRWNLSCEARAFALHNFQKYQYSEEAIITLYDGNGRGANVTSVTHLADTEYKNFDEFVFGGEVRATAAFELTRDVALQVGFEFFDLGMGVGRGFFSEFNDQDVQMAGAFFGAYWRR